MKKLILLAAATLLSALMTAQTAKPVVNSFTDTRDGKTYRTVKIGKQVWMAENLNFKTANSKCYENDTSYCAKYGRLYDWNDAMSACPAGWHLPSDDEWTTLVNYVGGSSTAGTKLKSTSGWEKNGNGTDDYGFSALPGGYGHPDGGFYRSLDRWWSVTEYHADSTWYWFMYYNYDGVGRRNGSKAWMYSVRCVRD